MDLQNAHALNLYLRHIFAHSHFGFSLPHPAIPKPVFSDTTMFGFGHRTAAAQAATDAQMDVESPSKELGGSNVHNVHMTSYSVRIVHAQEENNLSRALSQRHIQMIALAGAIVSRLVISPHDIHQSSLAD